jgi:hypothetical protein
VEEVGAADDQVDEEGREEGEVATGGEGEPEPACAAAEAPLGAQPDGDAVRDEHAAEAGAVVRDERDQAVVGEGQLRGGGAHEVEVGRHEDVGAADEGDHSTGAGQADANQDEEGNSPTNLRVQDDN